MTDSGYLADVSFTERTGSSVVACERLAMLAASGAEGGIVFHDEGLTLSWPELDQLASNAAAFLVQLGGMDPGRAVFLIGKNSSALVAAFFGCQRAGLVPSILAPNWNRWGTFIDSLLLKCKIARPAVALFDSSFDRWSDLSSDLSSDLCQHLLPLSSTVGVKAAAPKASVAELAFLQFTSGSVLSPRAVMVTHENVFANCRAMATSDHYCSNDIVVSWLPLSHDMGLVGTLLNTVFSNWRLVLSDPSVFIRRPASWLRMITDYRATITVAPHFAYALCAQKLADRDLMGLDLSTLRIAYNGSEPIVLTDLLKFQERFGPSGLKTSVIRNVYGLAETVLAATFPPERQSIHCLRADRAALQDKMVFLPAASSARHREVVGVGYAFKDHRLEIRDAVTRAVLEDDRVGEIWLKGPSVTRGYLGDSLVPEDGWLATGDLGFLHGGELFVCGRKKDVIKRGGRAVFPSDIEAIAGRIDGVRLGGVIAFELCGTQESLVGVSFETRASSEAALVLAEKIREQVAVELDVSVDALWAVRPGQIPKTTSGKPQRQLAAQHAASGLWGAPVFAKSSERASPDAADERITELVRRAVGRRKGPINGKASLMNLGLDSLGATQLAVQLEEEFKVSIPDSWDFGRVTLRDLIEFVKGGSIGVRADSNSAHSQQSLPLPVAAAGRSELLEWLHRYAATHINSRQIDERKTIHPGIVLEFGNRGLFGLMIPAEYGGLGLSTQEAIRVGEHLMAVDPAVAKMIGIHNCLGCAAILNAGTEAQKHDWLPKLARGRELVAFAVTEPVAGSNPHAMQAEAVVNANGWTLSGTKQWIGLGGWAQLFVTFAHEVNERGERQGIRAFVVPADRDGVRVADEVLTMGVRGLPQNHIEFRAVALTADDCLGGKAQGFAIARKSFDLGRLFLAAGGVGTMKRCLRLMHRYAERREISTGRLRDNPFALDSFEQAFAAIEVAECMTRTVASWRDAGELVPEAAYLALKTTVPEWAFATVDRLIQLLGGRGYLESNMAAQWFRDVRLWRIFEGPTEALEAHLGSLVLAESEDVVRFFQICGAQSDWALLHEATRECQKISRWDSENQDRAWHCQQAGRLAGLSMSQAILRLGGSPLASRWVAAKWSAIRSEWENIGSRTGLTEGEIDTRLAEMHDFTDGRPWGEDRELDPLLRGFAS